MNDKITKRKRKPYPYADGNFWLFSMSSGRGLKEYLYDMMMVGARVEAIRLPRHSSVRFFLFFSIPCHHHQVPWTVKESPTNTLGALERSIWINDSYHGALTRVPDAGI